MKQLLTLACLLGLWVQGCTPRQKAAHDEASTTAEPVSLGSATGQRWTAGIKGGGSGTEYAFRVVVNTAEPVGFDHVMLGGTPTVPVVAKRGAVTQAVVVPHQGDTLDLRVSLPGAATHTQATIHYTTSGAPHVLDVPTIEMLPPLNRP